MQRSSTAFGLRHVACLLAVPAMLVLMGCQGVSSASKQTMNPGSGKPANSPFPPALAMSFGSVAVGGNSVTQGTLTAGSSDITITSAALERWYGDTRSAASSFSGDSPGRRQNVPDSVHLSPPSRRKRARQRRVRQQRHQLPNHRNSGRNRNPAATVPAQRRA